MLRLAAVFLVWIASTAWALDDTDADYDAELHEAYLNDYRAAELRYALTNTNVRTIISAHGRAHRSAGGSWEDPRED